MITNLDQFKSSIDVVDVVSNSLELKKNGANFKACCPFHGEDTPSLVVSPQKQIWHCFGCGAGGDAIKFVEEYKKVSFTEAVEDIANDMNFTLTYDRTADIKDYKALMEQTNDFYKSELLNDKLQYLLERGITKESIETFEIGYATSSQAQIDNLTQRFLNPSDSIDVGILAKDKNKTYARLTHRITFPIRNHTNKLIGFGGRILNGDRAKYLNSPQTKLFDKSRNLYGYNIAKEHVYKKGTIVITEGYLDVVMMHQADIKTAVATMGTALTKEHCNTIKKADVKVLLCYDGDKAGRNAGFKASKLLSEFGIDGGVILFDDGVDPADMVKDGKTKELYEIMKKPIALIIYALNFISNSYETSNPHEKNKALQESLEFLNKLNPVIADEYKDYLAKLLHVNEAHINMTPKVSPVQETKTHGVDVVELSIIATTINNFALLNIVLDNINTIEFTTHKQELTELVSMNTNKLQYILLRDDIKLYSPHELKSQLNILSVSFYTNKLKRIYDSNMETLAKIKQIRETQKEINRLKQLDFSTKETAYKGNPKGNPIKISS